MGELTNLKESVGRRRRRGQANERHYHFVAAADCRGAVCIPFKKYWAAGVTVVSSVATLFFAARIAWLTSSGNSVTSALESRVRQWIAVDGLSALIFLLIALIATTAAIFSVGYMAHENLKPWKLRLYYANYNLFVFSMLAIPFSPSRRWFGLSSN